MSDSNKFGDILTELRLHSGYTQNESAQGICQTFGVGYTKVEYTAELSTSIAEWLREDLPTASLIEVMV